MRGRPQADLLGPYSTAAAALAAGTDLLTGSNGVVPVDLDALRLVLVRDRRPLTFGELRWQSAGVADYFALPEPDDRLRRDTDLPVVTPPDPGAPQLPLDGRWLTVTDVPALRVLPVSALLPGAAFVSLLSLNGRPFRLARGADADSPNDGVVGTPDPNLRWYAI